MARQKQTARKPGAPPPKKRDRDDESDSEAVDTPEASRIKLEQKPQINLQDNKIPEATIQWVKASLPAGWNPEPSQKLVVWGQLVGYFRRYANPLEITKQTIKLIVISLYENGKEVDLILITENTGFKVHQAIFCSQSLWFDERCKALQSNVGILLS